MQGLTGLMWLKPLFKQIDVVCLLPFLFLQLLEMVVDWIHPLLARNLQNLHQQEHSISRLKHMGLRWTIIHTHLGFLCLLHMHSHDWGDPFQAHLELVYKLNCGASFIYPHLVRPAVFNRREAQWGVSHSANSMYWRRSSQFGQSSPLTRLFGGDVGALLGVVDTNLLLI